MGIEVGLMALSAVGTVAQYEQNRKAASRQKDAMRAEKQRADIQNVRAIRQNIRQARMAEATMVNQAALGGGMGGSALAGGVGSIGSQMAGNLSFMSDIADQNTAIFDAQMGAITAQQNAALYGTIGQLAGQGFKGYTGQTFGEYAGAYAKKNWG